MEMARQIEAALRLDRTPPASRYSADMSKHAYLGTEASLLRQNQEYAGRL